MPTSAISFGEVHNEKNIDFSTAKNKGHKALYLAITTGLYFCVKALLEKFPKIINEDISCNDKNSLEETDKPLPLTPLDLAIDMKNEALIILLIRKGGLTKSRRVEDYYKVDYADDLWADKEQKLDNVIAYYDQVLAKDAKNAEAYFHRGNNKINLGRYAEGFDYYDIAIKLDPDNAHYFIDSYLASATIKQFFLKIWLEQLMITIKLLEEIQKISWHSNGGEMQNSH